MKNLIDKIILKSRFSKKIVLICSDSILMIALFYSSFAIRLGYFYEPNIELIRIILFTPIIAIPIFMTFGLYRTVIRFMSFNSLWLIVKAVSIYLFILATLILLLKPDFFPRSIIIIYWLLSIFALIGSRLFVKWLLSSLSYDLDSKNVVIYGAGSAGRELSTALSQSREYKILYFLDDSVELYRQSINGFEVLMPKDLDLILRKSKIDEILLAIPSISGARRSEILDFLEKRKILVRSVPSFSDLTKKSFEISDLHNLSVKDLLGRESISPDKNLLVHNIQNKAVLVTGAGGSIGSELCRQILILKPNLLILFEISEFALYTVHKELAKFHPNAKILPILGSVVNENRFNKVLDLYQVNTIYHAAAYKHVPMVEFNSIEGINNNIFSTLHCAKAAINNHVETFVLISTDKAVRPSSTMGATKRFSEIILQALSEEQSTTKFSIVRFGNVLNSSGSVIPLFKQQIKDGGPVTVTDPKITRYFMTISEAVELVIQAGSMGNSGDVFVLEMGQPIKITDLARKMIHLSGFTVKDSHTPNGDIEIIYTGLRPGEKLYEELIIGPNVFKTSHPKIMRAEEQLIKWNNLEKIIYDLTIQKNNCNEKELRKILIKSMPEFKPLSELNDNHYHG